MGRGPWQSFRWGQSYPPTPSADPVYLYTDDLVAIVPERRLNNGQPQQHAHRIHEALPAAGEHVVHVGTGAGYDTAINDIKRLYRGTEIAEEDCGLRGQGWCLACR